MIDTKLTNEKTIPAVINIRTATILDAEDILKIYAPYISDTCVSFETEVPTVEEFSSRIENILKEYPYLVCEADGKIIGYAYAGKHRERAAYRYSVDVTVYIAMEYHRKGIGGKLYSRLFELLYEQGFSNAYAGVALPNDGSIGLHKALGFTEVGVYHNVGYKHGKWLDVMWLEKSLQPQFMVEKDPTSRTVESFVSMIREYAGEYFTDDFADSVSIDAPFQRICYLKYGNELVSGIMFTCLDGCPHITAMVTKRMSKNKGYGKTLMKYFAEHVSQLGFHSIELYAWSDKTKPICASTQAFYKNAGFVVEKEHMGLWAPNMITFKMKKEW